MYSVYKLYLCRLGFPVGPGMTKKFFDILETKRKLKLRFFVPYFALSSRADVKKEQKLKKQQNLHVAY